MTPEEAVAAARDAAAQHAGPGGRERPLQAEPVTRTDPSLLYGWAFIEPDEDLVYSTRRYGAPITFAKRALLRVLRQYHGQVLAEQSRFNAHVAAVLMNQEERLRELEAEAERRRAG